MCDICDTRNAGSKNVHLWPVAARKKHEVVENARGREKKPLSYVLCVHRIRWSIFSLGDNNVELPDIFTYLTHVFSEKKIYHLKFM